MRLPQFRIRTLMIVVVVAALVLTAIVLALSWMHFHGFYIRIYTTRF